MCCSEVGIGGLVILIVALVLCFLYGIACLVFAFLFFRSENRSWILIVGIIIVGLAVMLATIIAAFFDLDVIAGYVGFAMVFFILLVPLGGIIFAYRVEGKKSIVNLVILIVTPLVMGVAAIAVMLLLVEDEQLGRTALRYVLIVVIVVDFCYALGLFLCAVFFFVMYRRDSDVYSLPLFYIIGIVVAGCVALLGVACACFFELSDIAAIVGFALVLLVQGAILAYLAIPYFIRGEEQRTWIKLMMIVFSGLFGGLTLFGIITAVVRFILGL